MADNVIHGEGKPRFVIPTSVILTGKTVASATATTVVINEATDLTSLDAQWGLFGIEVWTKNSSDETTFGVIQSFNDTTETLTVDVWSNGNPAVTKAIYLQGRVVDLPFCQRLTEGFVVEDGETVKKRTGRLRILKRGFRYRASLDYSRYLHKDEVEQLEKLFSLSNNGFGFYPRKDNTAVFYSVEISPDSELSFYQLAKHWGHGGIIIELIGLDRLAQPPLSTTGTATGYGEAYGTDYGGGL